MTLIALVFHFVIVCHEDYGCSYGRLPYGMQFDGWGDRGPYFTIEDCEEGRKTAMKAPQYWGRNGISECYANTITWKGDH